jgi:stress response protein SCP2
MSDPYIEQKPGHRIESGTSSLKQGKIDYSVSTDNNQGFIFYQNGKLMIRNNTTSMELCGEKLTDNKTPAKTIDAANGDIHIRAKNGTIILEAANIRLVAVDGSGGEITLQASRQINLDAPIITNQGTNITLAGSQSSSVVGGGSVDLTASGQVTTSSGVDTDSSSFVGQILQASKKFKDFFTA